VYRVLSQPQVNVTTKTVRWVGVKLVYTPTILGELCVVIMLWK
jgi:hypothetical protein